MDIQKKRSDARKYYRTHRDEIKQKVRDYKTIHRGHIRLKARDYYEQNTDRLKSYFSGYHSSLHRKVFDHYGRICKCCGETEEAFLSIDHVNGDGYKHRKEIGAGKSFYRWLIKNNFPDGFQTLCMNCNFAKGKLGKCPHQERVPVQRNMF